MMPTVSIFKVTIVNSHMNALLQGLAHKHIGDRYELQRLVRGTVAGSIESKAGSKTDRKKEERFPVLERTGESINQPSKFQCLSLPVPCPLIPKRPLRETLFFVGISAEINLVGTRRLFPH